MNHTPEHRRLVQAARSQKRELFASLPWGMRLAHVFFNLRLGGTAEEFGRTAYGLFLMHGVTGMPPAPFIPTNNRQISRLPSSYGKAYGTFIRSIIIRKLKTNSNSSDAVEDILAIAWQKLVSPSAVSAYSGKTLQEAEKYVNELVKNTVLSYLKYERRRRHEEYEEMTDAVSNGSWENLDTFLLESQKEAIVEGIQQKFRKQPDFAADIPKYISLLFEGYNPLEIWEGGLLPSLQKNPISYATLMTRQEVVREVFREHITEDTIAA